MEEEAGEENEEYTVRQRINKDGNKNNKTCRTRIDKLATPNRRIILALYQEHAYHLPRDKVEKIKQYLQELYAMTPEETEKYFLQLRREAKKMSHRKRVKEMLRKLFQKRKRQRQEGNAYRFVERLFERGMQHAFNNPVPPLISVRLRNLADIVLEQICDLRNVDKPNREDPDQAGLFLIAVADWIAIAIEHVYYGVQLRKNAELEEIEEEAERAPKKIEESPPIVIEEPTDVDRMQGEDTDISTVLLGE
ncbi:hypothetical protein NQ318_010003 [Aromia moschata]|uniref:Uncharacterized protein n=1 Tax=Aromia moschata TaxID=1265417 RepID=A0AAV8YAD6_9CUCU|nr:hypothetical protein NQ318_010003 [Aromia moschata]